MSLEFYAEHDPSKELQMKMEAFAGANPFYTSTYIDFRRSLGFQPYVFILRRNGQPVAGCTAFMKFRYLYRTLEIPSLPILPDGDAFTYR